MSKIKSNTNEYIVWIHLYEVCFFLKQAKLNYSVYDACLGYKTKEKQDLI